MMDSDKFEESAKNIPHMHLFLDLKRKYPELKDGDIADSIQRFGLDRDRCEEELCLKMRDQHRGYYSPWGQSRSASVSSTGCRNSPLSPSTNSAFVGVPLRSYDGPSHVENTTNEITPTSQCPETVLVDINTGPDIPPLLQPHPLINQPASPLNNPTTSSSMIRNSNGNYGPLYSSPSTSSPPTSTVAYFQPIKTHDAHSMNARYDLSVNEIPSDGKTPNSAPVKPSFNDPFSRHTTPNRRSSAESARDQRKLDPSRSSEMIYTQLERKNRLQVEVTKRLEEKNLLETENETLAKDLQRKELEQILDVEKFKKKVEELQQDNILIQSVCDERIRDVLESGESPATEEDHSGPPSFVDSDPYSPPLDRGLPSPVPPQYANQTPILNQGDQLPGPAMPGVEVEQKQWSCTKCTYYNSPYLNECEMCGCPHLPLGTSSSCLPHEAPPPPPPQSAPSPSHSNGELCYCHRHHFNTGPPHAAGGLQDIHIQVRHQNLHSPSKPEPPLVTIGQWYNKK